MEKTQAGLRKRIAFAGLSNVGKSSLMNALLGSDVSIVSAQKGTTTDTVAKAYEILGLGPVVLCDTAGFDDGTNLNAARQKAAFQTILTSDAVVFVKEANANPEAEKALLSIIEETKVPCLTVYNKADVSMPEKLPANVLAVSAKTGQGLDALINALKELLMPEKEENLLEGLVSAGDKVLLVTPIDTSAPKGRLILPQVQALRECLDRRALTTVVQTEDVAAALTSNHYDLVITDSKVIKEVLQVVKPEQGIATFSVLFARAKGDFATFLKGVSVIDSLQAEDLILIAESCVHTTNEDDIARTMIPRLLQKYTGKALRFEFARGKTLPSDMAKYRLIVQCGGCMLSRREMMVRVQEAQKAGTPITNYGLCITKCQCGNLERLTY